MPGPTVDRLRHRTEQSTYRGPLSCGPKDRLVTCNVPPPAQLPAQTAAKYAPGGATREPCTLPPALVAVTRTPADASLLPTPSKKVAPARPPPLSTQALAPRMYALCGTICMQY